MGKLLGWPVLKHWYAVYPDKRQILYNLYIILLYCLSIRNPWIIHSRFSLFKSISNLRVSWDFGDLVNFFLKCRLRIIFRITVSLKEDCTYHIRVPSQRVSDMGAFVLRCCYVGQSVEQTVKLLVIWHAKTHIWQLYEWHVCDICSCHMRKNPITAICQN